MRIKSAEGKLYYYKMNNREWHVAWDRYNGARFHAGYKPLLEQGSIVIVYYYVKDAFRVGIEIFSKEK